MREGGREGGRGNAPLGLLGLFLGLLPLSVLLLLHELLQLPLSGRGVHVLHFVHLVGETHLEEGREGCVRNG